MPTACSDYVEESNYLAAQARPGDMTLPVALLVTACTKTQAQLVQQDVNALHR